MDKLDQLMSARNELEFFLTLLGSTRGDLTPVNDPLHGTGIRLVKKQNLYYEEGQRKVFQLKTTHEFCLFQDSTLTWSVLGQPTITGLQEIQLTLEKYRESLLQTHRPDNT